MRLIVLMNVFNEADHIAKAIESVHEVADEIWVFDGAYKNYPHKKPYSTDGTLEIAKKYPKVKIYKCKKAWDSQIVKRSAMFKDGKEGDYFLKLDGDEYIANPEVIRDNLDYDVGWCWTLSNIYPRPYKTARIFKYQEGLHYAGRHHWLYNGNNVFVTSDQRMNLRFKHRDTPIRLFNFRDSSTIKRLQDKRDFLNNRNPEEQSFKREDLVYGKPCERMELHPDRAGEPNRTTSIIREVSKPDYTFTLMVSRGWALERYFKCLDRLKLPENTEAIVVVDSPYNPVKKSVYRYFENDERFVGVKIIYTNNPRLPENSQVNLRRQRIIDNWHLLMTEARGEIILASEDDSLPEPNAYMKMLDTMKKEKADFVQGNIIGRWGTKMCPAWRIIEQDNRPVILYNDKERTRGITQVQGVGWYCFVAPTDIVRKYQMIVDDTLPLGPDVRFGYELSKKGYKLLHQWDVSVEHFGQDFSLLPGRDKTEQRIWYKNLQHNIWNTKVYDAEGKALVEKEFNLSLQ